MRTTRCPSCRQRLGAYLYALECPFCHEDIRHNQKQEDTATERLVHAPLVVAVAGIVMSCALLKSMGVPLPGWGEPASVAGHLLRILGAGLVGAALGFFLSTLMARHAQGARRRRMAFLTSFDLRPVRGPRHAGLPIAQGA
jgi:hypothetical protein